MPSTGDKQQHFQGCKQFLMLKVPLRLDAASLHSSMLASFKRFTCIIFYILLALCSSHNINRTTFNRDIKYSTKGFIYGCLGWDEPELRIGHQESSSTNWAVAAMVVCNPQHVCVQLTSLQWLWEVKLASITHRLLASKSLSIMMVTTFSLEKHVACNCLHFLTVAPNDVYSNWYKNH